MLEVNILGICVQISSRYLQKWLRYSIKHVKNRHFSRHFWTLPRFSEFCFLTDFDASKCSIASLLSMAFSTRREMALPTRREMAPPTRRGARPEQLLNGGCGLVVPLVSQKSAFAHARALRRPRNGDLGQSQILMTKQGYNWLLITVS